MPEVVSSNLTGKLGRLVNREKTYLAAVVVGRTVIEHAAIAAAGVFSLELRVREAEGMQRIVLLVVWSGHGI